MKTTIIIVFFGLLTLSCKNAFKGDIPYLINVEDGIDNVGEPLLSMLGKHLSYVPLETDSASLFRRVNSMAVTDSFIFANDGTRLLKFSTDGEFLANIGSEGRGPGEYINLSAIQADNDSKELYVLSMKQMLVFDFNGNLKRTFKIDFPVRQFQLTGDNNIIFHPINLPEGPYNEFSLHILDRSGNPVRRIRNDLPRENKGVVVPSSPMYISDGSLYFMEFGTDTLHEYNQSGRKAYAVFRLGNLKMPPDPTMEEAPNITGLWINDSKETGEFILFSYWEGLSRPGKNCIYDKKSGSITVLKDNKFVNDIDGGLSFWPERILDDNTLVDTEDAINIINHLKEKQASGEVLDKNLQDLLARINENSNPVLVFLR